jgi:prophage DNA circulation protein
MAIATIRDLAQVSTWRQKLLPAHFDGFLFHVESGSMESGTRVVTHEFPKKDLPYSESMGKKATEFTIRGYMIQFNRDTGVDLYKKDYTIARDKLQTRLETGQPGNLQLPTMQPMVVMCTRYRMSEEERLGGYVTFDMSFVELGVPPFNPTINPATNLIAQSDALKQQVTATLSPSTFGGGTGGGAAGGVQGLPGSPSGPPAQRA